VVASNAVIRAELRFGVSGKIANLTICQEIFRKSSVVSVGLRAYNGIRMLLRIVRLAIALSLLPAAAMGRSKSKEPAPKDAIDVAGQISITGGPVTRLVTTQHYSRTYLYAEHASTNTITVIDVTDRSHPQIVSNLAGTGALLSATGDAALVSSIEPVALAVPTARTISILDFSDKASPKVAREFKGVTTVGTDDAHGLVFLADTDSIWILHRNPALDPEVQERYAHDVVYNH
jgi:lipocalin